MGSRGPVMLGWGVGVVSAFFLVVIIRSGSGFFFRF
jgi:hypothetical protein